MAAVKIFSIHPTLALIQMQREKGMIRAPSLRPADYSILCDGRRGLFDTMDADTETAEESNSLTAGCQWNGVGEQAF